MTSAVLDRPATKAQEAFERLAALAREMEPNAKLPTVQQLRKDLGVSLTTLDAVLNQLERQNIIFRKQGSGIFVSPHLRQRCVGLVCDPEFFRPGSSPFWQEFIEGARSWASINGEAFRFYMAVPSAREDLPVSDDLIEDVRAGRLQGIIFVGTNKPAVKWLESMGLPVVAFAGVARWKVHIDYTALILSARRFLAERGFVDPALVLYGDGTFVHFESPLASQGLSFRPERVVYTGLDLPPFDTQQEEGYAAIFELLGPQRRTVDLPDSLILTDDMMTRGALVAMRKLGIQPGKDIEIVSHTNVGSMVLHGHEDEMSFIEVDPAALVKGSFDILEAAMEGNGPEADIIQIPPVPEIRGRV